MTGFESLALRVSLLMRLSSSIDELYEVFQVLTRSLKHFHDFLEVLELPA